MYSVDAETGTRLAKKDLVASPVHDRMMAANGRLYIAMNNGRIKCFVGTNLSTKN